MEGATTEPSRAPSGQRRPPDGRRRALISVADKRGIVELARGLHGLGWELVSTGGTARTLEEAGVPVVPVSRLTGYPELLEGRVKTLHPAVHAAILARRQQPDHMATLAHHGLTPIDLVVVNLYPFEQAAAAGVAGLELLEHIDIGGPALIRAAAKNWPDVTVLVDPADYPPVLAALGRTGHVEREWRRQLAVKAFLHTAHYDAVIALTLAGLPAAAFSPAVEADRPNGGPVGAPKFTALPGGGSREGRAGTGAGSGSAEPDGGEALWPDRLVLPLRREGSLRYGENPHQQAAVYRLSLSGPSETAGAPQGAADGASHRPGPADGASPAGPGASPAATASPADGPPLGRPVGGFRHLAGKDLSYNNLLDAHAAWRAVRELTEPAVVAVKHMTPCGAGSADTLAEAFRLARDADPESIFGGIVACNRPVDAETAALLSEIFLDVVIAPGYTPEAWERLAAKGGLRLLIPAAQPHQGGEWAEDARGPDAWEWRGLGPWWLVQTVDPPLPVQEHRRWRVVAGQLPLPPVQRALDFAWRVVKHCRSNAAVIAVARGQGGLQTVGIGAGQTSRVRAVEQALAQAGPQARGSVLASDGFFPFPDSVERAAAAGVVAIVQPGGSVRDDQVVEAAQRLGITMLTAGRRHFRH